MRTTFNAIFAFIIAVSSSFAAAPVQCEVDVGSLSPETWINYYSKVFGEHDRQLLDITLSRWVSQLHASIEQVKSDSSINNEMILKVKMWHKFLNDKSTDKCNVAYLKSRYEQLVEPNPNVVNAPFLFEIGHRKLYEFCKANMSSEEAVAISPVVDFAEIFNSEPEKWAKYYRRLFGEHGRLSLDESVSGQLAYLNEHAAQVQGTGEVTEEMIKTFRSWYEFIEKSGPENCTAFYLREQYAKLVETDRRLSSNAHGLFKFGQMKLFDRCRSVFGKGATKLTKELNFGDRTDLGNMLGFYEHWYLGTITDRELTREVFALFGAKQTYSRTRIAELWRGSVCGKLMKIVSSDSFDRKGFQRMVEIATYKKLSRSEGPDANYFALPEIGRETAFQYNMLARQITMCERLDESITKLIRHNSLGTALFTVLNPQPAKECANSAQAQTSL